MLEKCGWKSGEGLGKTKQGIKEPVKSGSVRIGRDQSGFGGKKKSRSEGLV